MWGEEINRISEFLNAKVSTLAFPLSLSLCLPFSPVKTGCELVSSIEANRCSPLCFLRIVVPYSFEKSQFGITGGGKANGGKVN